MNMESKSNKNVWEEYWKGPEHQPRVVHKELLSQIEKNLGSLTDKIILEVGGGMGGDSIELAKKGAKVVIVDFSDEALSLVRSESKSENIYLETKKEDAENLSFPDETFDCVFHQGLLEHFESPQRLLDEQYRVLKKGGIIVIDVPQRYTTYTLKKHWQMMRGKWFAGWEKEFSIGELEKIVKENGFEIVASYGWGYYGKLHTLRYLGLGRWYDLLWKIIEKTRIKLYLSWCIGVVGRKK